MKIFFICCSLGISLWCNAQNTYQRLSSEEVSLIINGEPSDKFRVLQVTSPKEFEILKNNSIDIDPKDRLIPLLAQRMLFSVLDPANPGVGIAAPQIGLNRNAIWVQRFDKEDKPFEFYINPKITWHSLLLQKGMEGCLSIPDALGEVMRNYAIQLSYYDLEGAFHEEIIEGFTSVIFQHESDHLLGILFTDRIEEQSSEDYTISSFSSSLFIKKENLEKVSR